MVVVPQDRERTAERLLRSSAKQSYDPMTEIDWDSPAVPGAFHMHPQWISLYGTALWDGLEHTQRLELSKHEIGSMAGVGIWFELILMQMLIRHHYDRDPTEKHTKYALTEIADECRHSIMFATWIEKLEIPAYGPRRIAHELGRYLKTTSSKAETFGSILIAEEILDSIQRGHMTMDTIQPLTRETSRLHVIEEARHVRYAQEELSRVWPTLSFAGRAKARFTILLAAFVITRQFVHPDCYKAVGLDPRAARKAAAKNPARRETLVWASAKLIRFFEELGVINRVTRPLWRRAGLL